MIGLAIFTLLNGPNLVPTHASAAPDYFCTWNIQGYACSYTGAPATRASINETSLFGKGKDQGWLEFYPRVRRDLIFVMDDSWDMPPSGDERALGRLQLDEAKFPSFHGDPSQRMAALTKAVKAKGWKGLGGWMCAQECPLLPAQPSREYWADRLQELSSLSYLKVDWGTRSGDLSWRKMLAELRPASCPSTLIESAMVPASLAFADTFRTYDVETVISAPTTLSRIASLLSSPAANGSPTIINCEDEVYIAAALGCSFGVMRHPVVGALPDGRQDFVFPPTCRDLKHRMDEVIRAAYWHRIAPPLAAGSCSFFQSSSMLTDRWTMHAGESWMDRPVGSVVSASASAIVSRGMPLPIVHCSDPEPPFVAASRYANGCVSVATIGRGIDRTYGTPLADVSISGASVGKPIGIFGHYKSLSIKLDGRLKPKAVWAQDLASGRAENVIGSVLVQDGVVTLPGVLIDRIGTMAASKGDVSDPGLVVVISE